MHKAIRVKSNCVKLERAKNRVEYNVRTIRRTRKHLVHWCAGGVWNADMNVIEKIRHKRKKLVEALDENEVKDQLFENFADMYPDQAHFIYELLQNAEDANATEVRFYLHQDRLLFEHNGRSFDDDDIDAITLIGKSPKQSDKIGRFGIGFKAVYLYTETPHIWSPAYSFKITDYCVPDELEQDSQLGDDTRFEFPFDKTDSSQSDICQVIKKGLEDISLNSLLFLANIKSLKWSYNNTKEILISRIEHPHHHVEIMQTEDERKVRSSDYLLFKKPVMELKAHNLALAYELEESSESPNGELKDRFKIRKASPGSVAIYFTAAKETSNLNFHLHAPFIPTRDRSSVKDIEENISLFKQLAALATESLEKVRDLGLLDSNFLNVMPNSEDNLPDSYECIKVAIAKAMYNRPLIPTVSGDHQPAKQLLQGTQIRTTQSIVRLFGKQDLKYLFDNGKGKTDWAIGVGGRASRLLKDLKIEQIDFENIIKVFHNNLYSDINTREIMFNWMNTKSDQWFQYYYAFMYSQISRLKISGHRQILQGLEIVRLADGKYKKGGDCFFQPEEGQGDSSYPLVAHSTYSSGGDSDEEKKERENARDFLKYLNVRELGKAERTEILLKNRYQGGNPQKIDWNTYVKDLKNFVKSGLEDSEMINLFRKYEIFASTNKTLCVSEEIYLDQPYAKTGLKEYYDQLNKIVEEPVCLPLSERYKTLSKKDLSEFIDFAKQCGVRTYLKPIKAKCSDNPQSKDLFNTRGWYTKNGTDEDFTVYKLGDLLNNTTTELSQLIWNNVKNWCSDYFVATYRPNLQHEKNTAPSQLLHHLINCKWIPQESGNSIRFVRPALAERELLPTSFAFVPHTPWLNDIKFGHELPDKVQGQKIAEQCGFENFETMKQMVEFGNEMKSRFPERWNAFFNKPSLKLPDQQPEDYERLQTEVRKEAETAPKQEFTRKLSRVSNVDVIKRDKTDEFLREMYTNEEKVMFCQICEDELPFKLSGGKYFFEKVKFIKGLKGIHYQNYLALCPNHAAMYMHANDSIDEMLVRFRKLKPNTQRVELTLAGNPFHIYFTKKHIAHLKAVLEVTDSNSDMSDDTESPIEDMLLAALREIPELPEPELQYEIWNNNGHLVTVPDFAYPDFQIAIYCDGYAHHGNKESLEQDAKKRNWLQGIGWKVLTYWGGTIYESPQDCAVEIKKVYLEKSNGKG